MIIKPVVSNILRPVVLPVSGNLADFSADYQQRGTVGSDNNAFESFTDLGNWSFTAGHTAGFVSSMNIDDIGYIPAGVKIKLSFNYTLNSGTSHGSCTFSLAQDSDWTPYVNQTALFRANAFVAGYNEFEFTTVASGPHIFSIHHAAAASDQNYTVENLRLEWL